MKERELEAFAYVVSKVHTLAGDLQHIVGVYPTWDLAKEAKVQQQEMWHDAIVTITQTTIRRVDDLVPRLRR